jgi:hypothetical protein
MVNAKIAAKSQKNVNKTCHDCGCVIKFKDKKIENGHYLIYEDNGEKITVLKCKACYKKNPSLSNFRNCEVYSRVVGYLRPVSQWNKGKQAEYKERKEYKTKKDSSRDSNNDSACREF